MKNAGRRYTGRRVCDTFQESRKAAGETVGRGVPDAMHAKVAGSMLGTVREMLPWAAKASMKRHVPIGDVRRRYVTSRVCRHVARRDESLGHVETLNGKMRVSDGLKRQWRAGRNARLGHVKIETPRYWTSLPGCRAGTRRCQDAGGQVFANIPAEGRYAT